MKKLTALAIFVLSIMFAPRVSAHEGLIDLTNSTVSCKGISLYQDGYYRVSGRCDGLVYPHETTYNRYVLWGKTSARGELIRIAEVDRGYFSGNIASPFDGVEITAENQSLVRRPSDQVIVTGKVSVFDFDKSKVTTSTTTSTSTSAAGSSTNTGMTVQSASEKVSSATSTAGAVVGRILTSLLVIILVIVGLVVGASLIFRNRGSVSN